MGDLAQTSGSQPTPSESFRLFTQPGRRTTRSQLGAPHDLTRRGRGGERPPAVRQVAGWITGLPGHLDPADSVLLQAIRARCPELDAAARHVAGFARMIKDLSGDRDTLAVWMGEVDTDLPVLRSFTAGLRRDLDTVVAGLTLKYNSGAVEGTVNRIKQQGGDVRTRETRPSAQAHTPGLNTATLT
jgi:hypothetical protein